VEVALSLVLTVGAGLLLRSFGNLMSVDLGFQPSHVVAMNIPLPSLRYRDQERRWQFFQQLEERVRAIPGVRSVGVANQLPLRGGWGTGIETDSDPGQMRPADSQAVSAGYFDTLGIPLVRGRLLTPDDRAGQPYVAVVNQTFSRQYFPGGDAMGRRLRRGSTAPWCRIVGVVNDIRRDGKAAEITPQIYLSAAQTDLYPVRLSDLAVRTEGDPQQVVKAVQQQVWALDKDQPVTNVRALDELIDASLAQRRFQSLLLVLFAAVAVTLATIGVYGVLSYSVSHRTSELGLRMALGATTRDILVLVLRQAGWLIAAGVAAGTAGAYALTRFLDSLLFGVHAHDKLTYVSAAGVLIAVSITASLIPARRGSHVDPTVALRYE
jgi:predicted permease